MAHASDPPEFLDVQVHQVSRLLPFVAADGDGRLEGPQPSQAQALQPPGDGGPAELQGLGDLGAGPALPAQPFDPAEQQRGKRVGAVVRPAGSIGQARDPLDLVPADPLAHGPVADAERLGHVPGRFGALLDALDESRSTAGRGLGILVDVHPGLRAGVVGGVATTSLPDEARVNNLLRLHT